LAPALSSDPQLAHFCFSCDAPHSEQNFAPSRSVAPHFIQGICATCILPPHSAQNLAVGEFGLPH
jgi:hypothetical protein